MRVTQRNSNLRVLGLVLAFWGLSGFGFWLLAGGPGIYVAVWVLGPFVVILTAIYFVSPFDTTPRVDLARFASHVGREVLPILRAFRWGKGAKILLTFAIATAMLWVRSYWSIDSLTVPTGATRYLLAYSRIGVLTVGWQLDSQRTGDEGIRFEVGDVEPYLQQTQSMRWIFAEANRGTARKSVFNPDRAFEWKTMNVTFKGRTLGGVSVSFPHWLLLLLFCGPAGWGLVAAYRRTRRTRSHCCAQCAYDLSGNVSGICPECGTAIAPDAPKTSLDDEVKPRKGERE